VIFRRINIVHILQNILDLRWRWMCPCLLWSPKLTCVLRTSCKKQWSYSAGSSNRPVVERSQSSCPIKMMWSCLQPTFLLKGLS